METPILTLSRDQIVTRIEAATKQRLHMGVRDFIDLYRSGRLPDPGAVADVVALAALLPDTDPLYIEP